MQTYLVSFIFSIFAAAFIFGRRRSRLPLPPGPKRLPWVGNLFNRPTVRTWLAFTDMKAQYGDIMSLEVFGQPFIVVNSAKVANELFEKRSSNYADRPVFRMANDLTDWWWDFAHMRSSEEWKLHRKIFHQYFQAKDVAQHQTAQLDATRTLLQQMFASPQDLFSHVRHHAGSIILRVTYGYKSQAKDDALVEVADKAIRGLDHALIPGYYLVDYFPLLKWVPTWFPFASFKRQAVENGKWAIISRDQPFYGVLNSMEAGTAEPCFITNNIERYGSTQQSGFDMTTVIKNAAGVAFVAGADTTVSVVLTALLALLHHPELVARAQAELDEVVGRDRLPNFDDYESLKFIEAITLEAMRWRPVAPLAIAHASVSDDVYEGYFIPGGSIVTGNAWAILHDEATYRDPSAFNPDRFLGSEPEPHPTSVFGFGRRICPGRYLAMNSAFMAIASLLWAFKILPEEDVDGKVLLPDVMAFTDGFVSHPLPFQCKILPRFEAVEDVLNTA